VGTHSGTIGDLPFADEQAAVASVTPATSLVDGATYSVTVSYQDALGNAPAVVLHSLVAFSGTATIAPALELPADNDKIPQVFQIKFQIFEDALADSVILVFTRTAGTVDSNSPHTLVLSSAHEILGTHTISLPALSTAASSAASAGAVDSVTAGDLVDGTTYSVRIKYQDRAGNPENSDFHSFVEFDTTKPAVTAVTMDLGTGLITISFTESINVDGLNRDTFFDQDLGQPWAPVAGTNPRSQAMVLNRFFISNAAKDGELVLGDGTLLTTADNTQIQFRLTENQRITAIEKSGTPGGDGIPMVFDVGKAAFFDQAANANSLQFNFVLTETPDTIQMTLDESFLDYSTGILRITASERINLDVSAGVVHLDRVFISNYAGDHRISLNGADYTTVDSDTITIALTETQRVQAIALSSTPGGDGGSVVIDVEEGAFQDIGLVNSQATDGYVVWTIATNSITVNEAAGEPISQGPSGTQGVLKTILGGAGVTSIDIIAPIGQYFETGIDILV
jgi:hypothetical protein